MRRYYRPSIQGSKVEERPNYHEIQRNAENKSHIPEDQRNLIFDDVDFEALAFDDTDFGDYDQLPSPPDSFVDYDDNMSEDDFFDFADDAAANPANPSQWQNNDENTQNSLLTHQQKAMLPTELIQNMNDKEIVHFLIHEQAIQHDDIENLKNNVMQLQKQILDLQNQKYNQGHNFQGNNFQGSNYQGYQGYHQENFEGN